MTGPDDIALRRLRCNDVAAYRELRLEALRLAPEAFGGSFEEDREKPVDDFIRGLEQSRVFAAIDHGGALLGMAGMALRSGVKLRHKAALFGLFVRPAARERGIGRMLAERVIGEARACAEELQLSVATGNVAAIALYTAAGFQEYGLERHALKVGDAYVDERLMALELDRS